MVKNLKYICKMVVSLMIVLAFIGCGGGGGDSGSNGGGVTPPPTVPTVVNYSVAQSTMTPLLNGTTANGIKFAVTSIHLAGALNRSTGEITLPENNGIAFSYDPNPLTGTSPPLAISVLTPAGGGTAQWIIGDNPTAGKFQVNVVGLSAIYVQVNGDGTVTITTNDGSTQSTLTWDEFKNVPPADPQYEVLASLAFNAIQAIYRYIFQTYTMLHLTLENQQQLEQHGVDLTETSLPSLTPNLHIQWGDTDQNGAVSPGDSFLSRFTNWLFDAPGSNQDYIYGGRLLLLNYWNGTNSNGNYVGGDFELGVNGDEFIEQEVNSGVPDPSNWIKLSEGGLQFLLSW